MKPSAGRRSRSSRWCGARRPMPTSAPAGARAVTASVGEVLGRLARIGAARGRRLAAHLFARALGNVLPVVGGLVAGGLAGARVARGAAVVLPRLGDAVAFLHLGLAVLGGRLRGGDG